VVAAIQAHQSEDRIRAKFQEYVQSIVDIAFDDAEFPDDATRRKVRLHRAALGALCATQPCREGATDGGRK
jgi:hypothetical protein